MIYEGSWGKEPEGEDIRELLRSAGVESSPVSLSHIPSGFTDNVFLLATSGNQYIVKEYLEEWHKKEATFYESIAPQHPELGAPILYQRSGRFILLEYLSPIEHRAFGPEDVLQLFNWIVLKHQSFLGTPLPAEFIEPVQRKAKYLITRPINQILDLQDSSILDRPIQTALASSEQFLHEGLMALDKLPKTLDHGDLEPQNLLISQNSNRLRVLDWVNARADTGLFDICQFLENLEKFRGPMTRTEAIQRFGQVLHIVDFEKNILMTEMLLNLNKIGFYIDKYTSGEKVSVYDGQSIQAVLQQLVQNFLEKYYLLQKNF